MPPVSPLGTAPGKPRPSEIDVAGLSDPGRVRPRNADHYLIASFHRMMQVHASSIPPEKFSPLAAYSRGYVFLVADGVGGFEHATEGSAQAIQTMANTVLEMTEAVTAAHGVSDEEVLAHFKSAIDDAHRAILALGEGNSAATTLTMWVGLWPRAYVVHVGDSRCYRLRDNVLQRITTDQTMAEALVDAGALARESPGFDRLSHVLVSALGTEQLTPQVVATDIQRPDSLLLCSDGLTRHVSEDEIAAELRKRRPAKEGVRALVDLALERGGLDNVTVLIGHIAAAAAS